MNESSLSQQLREAVDAYHDPESTPTKVENIKVFILKEISTLLTEHEALQRKADAGEALAEAVTSWKFERVVERHKDGMTVVQTLPEPSAWRDTALSKYREAAKPSDV